MAFTKITRTTEDINTGFGRVNTLIDDLKAVTNAKGASQIGLEDSAGNVTATNVEDAIAEIYTDTASVIILNNTFDENSSTTTGLTWGYQGGTFRLDNVVTTKTAGTVAGLTDDDVNYIEIDPSDGVVKANITGFTSGRIPIREVTTVGGSQTVSTDKRAWFSQVAAATTSTSGIVELALDSEAVTGTSDVVVITPDNLTARLEAPGEIGGTTPAEGKFTNVVLTSINTDISDTEVGYLNGVSSNIQTQLDTDVAVTDLADGTDGAIITWDTAGEPTTLSPGTDGQFLKTQGVGTEPIWETAGFYNAYLKYSHSPSSGTNGGSATSGSYQTRTIDTEDTDTTSIGSLSSNQITLPAGSYICNAFVMGYKVDENKAILYDTTGTATLLIGSVARSGTADNTDSRSMIKGHFTLSESSVLEIRHRVTTTQATNGWGAATGFGDSEVYLVAEFWRLV